MRVIRDMVLYYFPLHDLESVLAQHRVRQRLVGARTAQANMIRGLLMEYGIVIPQGIRTVHARVSDILGDEESGLDSRMQSLLRSMHEHLKELGERVDAEIARQAREDARTARLQAISGIGPLTASALNPGLG